jgi:hypothetical protein
MQAKSSQDALILKEALNLLGSMDNMLRHITRLNTTRGRVVFM